MAYTATFNIGPGEGNNYETLSLWHGGERNNIDDGDNWLVVLNPGDENQIFSWTDLRSWGNAGVDWEITISGAMTPGDYDTYAIRNDTRARLANNGGNKKLNLVGVSLVPSGSNSTNMFRMDGTSASVGEGTWDFLISSCQFDGTGGNGSNGMFEDRKSQLSSLYSYTIVNSTHREGYFYNGFGGLPPLYAEINVLGCTIDASSKHFTGISNQSWYNPSGQLSGSLFISHNFRKFMDVPSNPTPQFSAVDFITSETTGNVNQWISYSSNFTFLNSNGSQWKFGSEPSEGEVAFSGVRTDPGSYGNDYRLWDSANNLASGYVATASMPALDIAGNSRGTSPFDAGAFAIASDALNNAEVAFGKLFMRVH
jgi:hypothetical protein